MNENALSKKIVSMVLIMSIMLSVFVMPTHAVLTEALMLGGVVAAFAGACGIAILSTGNNAEQVNQYFYDRFTEWLERENQKLTVAEVLAGTAIQNGKLVIQNGISKVLSAFMPELVAVDIAVGYVQIDGLEKRLRYIQDGTTNYEFQKNAEIGVPYTYKVNGQPFTTTWNYNPSAYQPQVTRTPTGESHGTWYVRGKVVSSPQTFFTKTEMEILIFRRNGEDYLSVVVPHKDYYRSASWNFAEYTIHEYDTKYEYAKGTLKTGQVESVPSTTLGEEEATVIDIGTDTRDLTQFAETVGEKVATNTLTATYTNKIPVPPVPETDMSWIKGFHSIWEYVERMVESVGSAIRFIPQMIQAMPTEVTVFIFGGFVLLLFGGVISKLLQ